MGSTDLKITVASPVFPFLISAINLETNAAFVLLMVRFDGVVLRENRIAVSNKFTCRRVYASFTRWLEEANMNVCKHLRL